MVVVLVLQSRRWRRNHACRREATLVGVPLGGDKRLPLRRGGDPRAPRRRRPFFAVNAVNLIN